jgi:translation initiation factor 2 subunit 3
MADSDPEFQHDVPEDSSGESEVEETTTSLKSAMKKPIETVEIENRPELPPQADPSTLDFSKLTPLSPEIIARQATINSEYSAHYQVGF